MTPPESAIIKFENLIKEGHRLVISSRDNWRTGLPALTNAIGFHNWQTSCLFLLNQFAPSPEPIKSFKTKVTQARKSNVEIGIGILEATVAELRTQSGTSASSNSAQQDKHPSTEPTTPSSTSPAQKTPHPASQRFDVALVCALHSPELEKILETGSKQWLRVDASFDDPHSYYKSTYTTKAGKEISLIAAAPNQMGLTSSAVLATKMILKFKPSLVAMVGIAAGTKAKDQGFGDILAAEHTFDYGSGKLTPDGKVATLQPDPKPIDIDPRILTRLKEWERERFHLDEIQRSWPAQKPPTQLKLRIGPLGSGAAVINSASQVSEIKRHWRKLIGIEMEAYGVHRATRDTVSPAPLYLCLKSICDFANKKTDDWQSYAAFTAAQFFYRFATDEWERIFPDKQ